MQPVGGSISGDETVSEDEPAQRRTAKRPRGRPRTGLASRSRAGAQALQVVGTGPDPADALPAHLAHLIPTMDVVIAHQRRFYTREQKTAVAAYAALVGRNKAADELGLNRPMVGRWLRAHTGATVAAGAAVAQQQSRGMSENTRDATAAESAATARAAITPAVVVPPGMAFAPRSMSSRSSASGSPAGGSKHASPRYGEAVLRQAGAFASQGARDRGGKTRHPHAQPDGQPVRKKPVASHASEETGDGPDDEVEVDDEDDNDDDDTGTDGLFSAAFAAIREAARAAIGERAG
ncbi:hypothetical protein HDU83_001100 [Entophlyctis luteolus]|nr:hypothetical protein HDU83_001100 [Entophlyctis luteolus]KAJ3381255.1 hypothetical protein HDU84_005249 [Entophlyctis sp. JEL0112]